jgi:hypothetical protein
VTSSSDNPKPPDSLELTADMQIEAAGGEAQGSPKPPRFSMVAYTGGAMRVGRWPQPVVIDLAGLGVPSQNRPIRVNHDAGRLVGHATAVAVESGRLVASGVLSIPGQDTDRIVAGARNGFPWQASVGATVEQYEFVKEDQSVLVNGQEIKGPAYVVRKSTLGEISFTDLGADGNTTASVAASAKESKVMATEIIDTAVQGKEAGKVQAQATTGTDGGGSAVSTAADPTPDIRAKALAETNRIAAIRKVCAGKHADIEAKAIEEVWDAGRAELEVLRAERPKAPAVTVTREHSPVQAVEAGLCLRATGDGRFVEAQYGRDILAGAERFRRMSLVQAAAACLRADGFEPDMDAVAVVRAALSTTSFPALLSNVANKALLKSFQDYPSTALRWCGQGDLPDFKSQTRARLNLSGSLQEIGPDGEPKHLTASDESAIVRLKTQALAFSVTRTDLINDDLGAITRAPAGFGTICRRKIDDLAYGKLLAGKLSDGTTDLFASGNKNYITGATTVLSAEGLRKGLETFRKQTDAVGNAVGLEPRFLLVPPELEFIAKQLVNSSSLQHVGAATAADKNNPTYNPFQGSFEVIVEPRLSNSTLTGYSATAWYLACDAALADTIEVDFLNGQRAPTITRVGNGSILRVEYEVVFDVEANVLDFRGMVKSKGAA